jgi:hypothetical protein
MFLSDHEKKVLQSLNSEKSKILTLPEVVAVNKAPTETEPHAGDRLD